MMSAQHPKLLALFVSAFIAFAPAVQGQGFFGPTPIGSFGGKPPVPFGSVGPSPFGAPGRPSGAPSFPGGPSGAQPGGPLIPSGSPAPTATTVSPGGPNIAVPAPSAVTNFNQLVLDPNFEITSTPQTRTYDWTISNTTGAPDGFERPILAINGQFPGPLIEANTGDTIVVNVWNTLDEGTSIHWHGITQNGTVFMDGLIGVNQCPIPPNGTFTYSFTLNDQFGTYWYHSHFSTQYTDGLQGPLIVHSPDDPLKIGQDFDLEQVVMVDDWWHEPAEQIFANLDTVGYEGFKIVSPSPDSVLINGVGMCGTGVNCTTVPPAEIYVQPGLTTRLRIINSGSHAQQRFSIDEHPLSVVEADDTPINALTGQHRVPIHNGQRYSVIVNATVGENGDAFWIRSSLVTTCLPWTATDLIPTGMAILRYVANGTTPSTTVPTSQDWSDPSTTGPCVDIPLNELVPILPQDVPPTVSQYAEYNVMIGSTGETFNVNNQTFVNHPFETLLQSVYDNTAFPTNIAFQQFDNITAADIIINNMDTVLGLTHPIHIHGRSFWIVATGNGSMTEADAPSVPVNTVNPILRDTLVVPAQTWAMLRLITDVPGVWGMHCHIAWHLADGLLGALVIQPEATKNIRPPAEWTNLCATGSATTVIPGKRSVSDAIYEGRKRHIEKSRWSRRNRRYMSTRMEATVF